MRRYKMEDVVVDGRVEPPRRMAEAVLGRARADAVD